MHAPNDADLELLLSAYVDGELAPQERARVEAAIARDAKLQARVDDLRALSALMRTSLEQEADAVDFSGFADRVMAGLPEQKRASVWSRFGVWLDELFTYHRWQAASGLAVAVTLLAVGPLIWDAVRQPAVVRPSVQTSGETLEGPRLAGSEDFAVIELETAEDTDAMLFKTASGTTVIYVQGN